MCAWLHSSSIDCLVPDMQGNCWVVPQQCPQIIVGASWRPCIGSVTCVGECQAIKSAGEYFYDQTCPQ